VIKKIIMISFILLVTFSLIGCKNTAETEPAISEEHTATQEYTKIETTSEEEDVKEQITKVETTTAETSDESIDVDKGLLNVTITLPASFFEDLSDFDPEAYTQEHGFKETVVNQDGSVSITMSKNKHNELMEEMKVETEETINNLIEGEDTPYIKEITSSKGFRTVTVDVDKEAYESSWDMTPLLIGMSTMMYQYFEGSEVHCEIIIRDVETKEILKSIIYPDALEE